MINKIVSVIGWFAIVFFMMGVFNMGVFKFSYVFSDVTEVRFSTDKINLVKKAKEVMN